MMVKSRGPGVMRVADGGEALNGRSEGRAGVARQPREEGESDTAGVMRGRGENMK